MNSYSRNQQNHLSSTLVADTNSNSLSIVSWLQTYVNNCIHHLVQGQEPRIWQKRNRFGDLQWYAHDPVTGRSLKSATENEVRVWLERVLYR